MTFASSQTLPDWVNAALSPLASLPGVLWCGLLERRQSCLHLLPATAPESAALPGDRTIVQVLVDALLTAGTALGDQLHQGPARELAFQFDQTGLLLATHPSSECAFLLAHAPGPGTALLRLALRRAAEGCAGRPETSTPALQPSLEDPAAFTDPGWTAAPPQSEVYNPFTSA